MRFRALVILLALAACLAWTRGRPAGIPFIKHEIDLGASEALAIADIDGDGRLDLVSGEFWYKGPEWAQHRFREIPFSNNYIDNFSDLAMDVNGNGRVDVISCSWFGKKLVWFENPGKTGAAWEERDIDRGNNVEFCFLVDIDGDGMAREVLPQYGNADAPLAWYEWKDGVFVKHVVSSKSYGHGIGAGDVNGDGRTDIVTPKGWWEAPADPRKGEWKWHGDFDLGSTGFIHVMDVNEDGRNDLLTSMAHDYGIFWMERGADGQWTKRMIDDSWSQAHALTLVDLDGDGRQDILTGKRYMAHNGRDPGEREPLGVYWYQNMGPEAPAAQWVRHVIDYSTRAGGGMQIPVADLDGDGDLDFAVAGKSGLFLFENRSAQSVARTSRQQ
jgi:hypothetical protein